MGGVFDQCFGKRALLWATPPDVEAGTDGGQAPAPHDPVPGRDPGLGNATPFEKKNRGQPFFLMGATSCNTRNGD